MFLGLHLYRSVIVLSIRVRGRTYIDRPSSCHISLCFWDRTYIDRSLSCQLEFGAAPISIDHLLVISVCVCGTAPILIGHFPCQFEFSGQHMHWRGKPCSTCIGEKMSSNRRGKVATGRKKEGGKNRQNRAAAGGGGGEIWKKRKRKWEDFFLGRFEAGV